MVSSYCRLCSRSLLRWLLLVARESLTVAPEHTIDRLPQWYYAPLTVLFFHVLSTGMWLASIRHVPAWLASALRSFGPVFAAPVASRWLITVGPSTVVDPSIRCVFSGNHLCLDGSYREAGHGTIGPALYYQNLAAVLSLSARISILKASPVCSRSSEKRACRNLAAKRTSFSRFTSLSTQAATIRTAGSL